jgi:hypothetical protein
MAQRVFSSILHGDDDFWSAIYTPFSNNDLPRDAVIATIDLARSHGAANMPAIASMLKACDPTRDEPKERKTFYRFKNFLYKTIRIT